MTSLAYGLDMPYEVQLEHDAANSNYMNILEPQRTSGSLSRHTLTPGVYMVSLSYNGPQEATLQHAGGGNTNTVTVPTGAAGTPRTSAPMKISVQGTTEYLQVRANTATGGSARATISVIPAATFDEMEESAQGASVLSEISNLKSTKADKSTLDARVPVNTSLRLDTSVGTRIFAGDTMIHGDTGWRDVSALFPEFDPTDRSPYFRYRRVGDHVTFLIRGTFLESDYDSTFGPHLATLGALPPTSYSPTIGYWFENPTSIRNLSSDGYDWFLQARGVQENMRITAVAQYYTRSKWPSTLPGLPL